MDVHGKSVVTNHVTGDTCEMDWKEKGWGGKNANMVFGAVKSADGHLAFKVQGRFNESLSIIDLETNEEKEVWRMKDKPENSDSMY